MYTYKTKNIYIYIYTHIYIYICVCCSEAGRLELLPGVLALRPGEVLATPGLHNKIPA